MHVLRASILALGFMFALLAAPITVSAHQSGCHRWHSCPSDTGSYVCGDLGYYSECGNTTTHNDPDYAGQGTDNGSQKADDDNAAIRAAAQTNAQEPGNSDGKAGDNDSPIPDATTECDKAFTYATPQPQEYVDAFHNSYLEACTQTYETAYNPAYETAYQSGTDEKRASDQQTISIQDAAAKSSAHSGYWWLAGLGLLFTPAAIGKLRKK